MRLLHLEEIGFRLASRLERFYARSIRETPSVGRNCSELCSSRAHINFSSLSNEITGSDIINFSPLNYSSELVKLNLNEFLWVLAMPSPFPLVCGMPHMCSGGDF